VLAGISLSRSSSLEEVSGVTEAKVRVGSLCYNDTGSFMPIHICDTMHDANAKR
jgi:hypothetical protein